MNCVTLPVTDSSISSVQDIPTTKSGIFVVTNLTKIWHDQDLARRISIIFRGKIFGSFLRSKATKLFKEFVYSYPNVKDRSFFEFEQIVSALKEPRRFSRGQFLFNISASQLNLI